MKSNDFAAAPQLHEIALQSKDRRNHRHFAEWRSFFSLRSFLCVSLMMIVTEYFRT